MFVYLYLYWFVCIETKEAEQDGAYLQATMETNKSWDSGTMGRLVLVVVRWNESNGGRAQHNKSGFKLYCLLSTLGSLLINILISIASDCGQVRLDLSRLVCIVPNLT